MDNKYLEEKVTNISFFDSQIKLLEPLSNAILLKQCFIFGRTSFIWREEKALKIQEHPERSRTTIVCHNNKLKIKQEILPYTHPDGHTVMVINLGWVVWLLTECHLEEIMRSVNWNQESHCRCSLLTTVCCEEAELMPADALLPFWWRPPVTYVRGPVGCFSWSCHSCLHDVCRFLSRKDISLLPNVWPTLISASPLWTEHQFFVAEVLYEL